MQANIPLLEKKAIKLALKEDWENALLANKEILDSDAKNINALIRTGRAYLNLKEFSKAQKHFKQVLDIDPINPVAKKNYELAKSKKTDIKGKTNGTNGRSLIKEPGTTHETSMKIVAKGLTANTFSYGFQFDLKVKNSETEVIYNKDVLGILTDAILCKKLIKAKNDGAKLQAYFLKGLNKDAIVLIESSLPIFKGEKQDIKPYMKKGSIDEVPIEIDAFDDAEE